MSEIAFNRYFRNLPNCFPAVPNVAWYRSAGGSGFSGEFTSNRKTAIMEDSYRIGNVFSFEFTSEGSPTFLAFCFAKNLPNAGFRDAWIAEK